MAVIYFNLIHQRSLFSHDAGCAMVRIWSSPIECERTYSLPLELVISDLREYVILLWAFTDKTYFA